MLCYCIFGTFLVYTEDVSNFPQHPADSVQVVILDRDRGVLLQKREDFRIWSLPGGKIEPGESPEAAAVREVLEETGLWCTLEHPVGFYWRPDMPNGGVLIQVFAGHVVEKRGEPGWESVAVAWCMPDSLPRSVPGWTRAVIVDALVGGAPARRIQRLPLWKAWLIRLLYALRALRNRLNRMGR